MKLTTRCQRCNVKGYTESYYKLPTPQLISLDGQWAQLVTLDLCVRCAQEMRLLPRPAAKENT